MIALGLSPLVVSLFAALATAWLVRRLGGVPLLLRCFFILVLAGSEGVELLWPVVTRTWSPAQTLPLQLSDVGTVVLIVALCRATVSIWTELAYYWGACAGLLGLAFPAIGAVSPSPLYFAFYANHGSLLVAATGLAATGSLRLGWRSILRAWAGTGLLAFVAGVANLATGGDYLFLRQPPASWSPLLVMGPWPWYVLSAAALCPLVLLALAGPRWRGNRWPWGARGPAAASRS